MQFFLKGLASVVAAVATTCVLLLDAMPAQAAQTRLLPTGEVYVAIDCNLWDGSMAMFDVATSVGTNIGSNTPTAHTNCAAQGAWDPTSSAVYWLSPSTPNYLMKADVTTGQSLEVAPISGTNSAARSIAIDDEGNAYLIARWFDYVVPDDSLQILYSLDLDTGEATEIATIDVGDAQTGNCYYSFAFNPADQQFYTNCRDNYLIKEIDVTNGSLVTVCDFTADPGAPIAGFAFDSSGIGWTANGGSQNIASFDVTQPDCGWQAGAAKTVNGSSWLSFSNAIVPVALPDKSPDELPSTGESQGTLIASVYSAGTAFALAAGVFLARHRLRKKARRT